MSLIYILASLNGHIDIVRTLLKKGAKIEERDLCGRTSLFYGKSILILFQLKV